MGLFDDFITGANTTNDTLSCLSSDSMGDKITSCASAAHGVTELVTQKEIVGGRALSGVSAVNDFNNARTHWQDDQTCLAVSDGVRGVGNGIGSAKWTKTNGLSAIGGYSAPLIGEFVAKGIENNVCEPTPFVELPYDNGGWVGEKSREVNSIYYCNDKCEESKIPIQEHNREIARQVEEARQADELYKQEQQSIPGIGDSVGSGMFKPEEVIIETPPAGTEYDSQSNNDDSDLTIIGGGGIANMSGIAIPTEWLNGLTNQTSTSDFFGNYLQQYTESNAYHLSDYTGYNWSQYIDNNSYDRISYLNDYNLSFGSAYWNSRNAIDAMELENMIDYADRSGDWTDVDRVLEDLHAGELSLDGTLSNDAQQKLIGSSTSFFAGDDFFASRSAEFAMPADLNWTGWHDDYISPIQQDMLDMMSYYAEMDYLMKNINNDDLVQVDTSNPNFSGYLNTDNQYPNATSDSGNIFTEINQDNGSYSLLPNDNWAGLGYASSDKSAYSLDNFQSLIDGINSPLHHAWGDIDFSQYEDFLGKPYAEKIDLSIPIDNFSGSLIGENSADIDTADFFSPDEIDAWNFELSGSLKNISINKLLIL